MDTTPLDSRSTPFDNCNASHRVTKDIAVLNPSLPVVMDVNSHLLTVIDPAPVNVGGCMLANDYFRQRMTKDVTVFDDPLTLLVKVDPISFPVMNATPANGWIRGSPRNQDTGSHITSDISIF